MTPREVAHFDTFGFVVLRGAIDPAPLVAEVEASLPRDRMTTELVVAQYAPTMTARTPTSLDLLDRFAPLAERLSGGPVCPLRAKAVRYHGETAWHRDSDHDVTSVGFLAYLDPLDAESGALRVLPGSHRPEHAARIASFVEGEPLPVDALPGIPLATRPGDVIVLDEHLWHASARGSTRRQWRVDYFVAPRDARERAALGAYLDDTFPPTWDGKYDPDVSPSYDADWHRSGRHAVGVLRDLGVYERASRQEDFMREVRRGRAAEGTRGV